MNVEQDSHENTTFYLLNSARVLLCYEGANESKSLFLNHKAFLTLSLCAGYKLIGSHSGVKLCRWTKVRNLAFLIDRYVLFLDF